MSRTKNRSEAERWLLTAEEDLKAAEVLFRGEMYAQACFYAQQAGEKGMKALWYLLDADPWGHSVQRLILDFPRRSDISDADTWIEWGALLDKFYIPTRYPNGLPDLTPGQAYRKEEAERGMDAAGKLVQACKKWMGES
ncbi:MAG: HEPN domain-containing protein [Desulfomonilaceae bacterium]